MLSPFEEISSDSCCTPSACSACSAFSSFSSAFGSGRLNCSFNPFSLILTELVSLPNLNEVTSPIALLLISSTLNKCSGLCSIKAVVLFSLFSSFFNSSLLKTMVS